MFPELPAPELCGLDFVTSHRLKEEGKERGRRQPPHHTGQRNPGYSQLGPKSRQQTRSGAEAPHSGFPHSRGPGGLGNVAPPGILARIPNEELILICSMREHFFRVRKSTLSWGFRLLQRCAIPHGRTGHFQARSLPPSLHLSVSPCLHLSLSLTPSLSLQRTASAWST